METSISFARPWILIALFLPLVYGIWETRRQGHPVKLPMDHLESPGRSRFFQTLLVLSQWIPAGLLALAVLALAGPQRLGAPQEKRRMKNIEFCLDVSGSMTAPFGEGSRYDGAMQAIDAFTQYRKGDAFGLTIFGNEVLHWTPLTKDTSAIRLATPFLRPENLPPWYGGTQIGKALRSCREILTRRQEGDRMIILVSDGMSGDLYGGKAQEIAYELSQDNIVVYTIHVADTATPGDMYTLASITGGEVFAAEDPAALESVFARIDSMEEAKLEQSQPESMDYFDPFAWSALALAGLHSICMFGIRYTPW